MSYRFSSRTDWDLRESAFSESIRRAKSEGRDLIDLTVSNPTVCGFTYDRDAILTPLSDIRALTYDPDPRGMLSARKAGLYVCGITTRYPREFLADIEAKPDVIADSYAEFREYFELS